ncbi:ABC transporter substrate-binding protein [Psychromonas ossibalaenae]|uniref:ABC transporter substrate-binding protein n=1 Tax=Psychromonas ossibalaenae TaxID=444922 RepID=UPI00036A652E|nr:ABC transporter substrate-binding protein [Psychromonas ossibalaenae]
MNRLLLIILLTVLPLHSSASQILRVGSTLWPGYEPLHYANEFGLYQKNSIRTIDYPSASEVLRAFKNRSLEAAALTLDEVVSLRRLGIKMKIILVCDVSDGADVILSGPEINSVKQLKAKRVAVEPTAAGAYLLSRALQIHNLKLNEIELVKMDVSTGVDAFNNDKADAFVTYEPMRTKLMNLGLTELFSSKNIPNEIVDVLVVHESLYHNNKQQLNVLIQGWFMAMQVFHNNPAKAYDYVSSRMQITPAQVKASYFGLKLVSLTENHKFLSGDDAELFTTWQKLMEHMKSTRLISEFIAADSIITGEFLPEK